jgi:hypothetical protein
LAEQDSVDAGDKPLERLPPRLDWTQAQIVPVETQKVKGHKRGSRSAPADHLAQAKGAIGSMQGLGILLLALVLGLLVWTSYGVYSQQQTETQTLVSQILQLDLALDHYGPEAERRCDLLKNELIETRETILGPGSARELAGLCADARRTAQHGPFFRRVEAC